MMLAFKKNIYIYIAFAVQRENGWTELQWRK